ncbi:putative tricarboxylic transport membrane protein [Saccharopolyspora kobensis]|uniref:Tricarboxylic transport membrane protein n=1 Tax=Saccharopolyspora kobensis TaxID=146035 RepID=A0A1H5WI36_9PSEU|nr:tripartite tricarboxylate transporter permease [Saccharopolyspora kobensis]SEF98527.1 putative tricarboxylic transport membrane protein [Saccharopolyspora kobensis]SFD75469.1 putative tricarboxylic transport membrane protein [Saccharopolyspora kobensis]
MLDNLLLGASTALSPVNLLWCFAGVLLGTVIGLLPGLGSSTGVAILIPLTLTVEPVTALIMLAGIYYGSQYGGTITSVLLSTPGEAASVVTTLDGYQMARQGRAGAALAIAAIGSFAAAIASLVLLAAVAPPLASVALNFGPPENLAVMVLALVTMVVLATGSKLRAAAMACAGVLLACVGIDAGTGQARYTFGSVELLSGIPYIEVVIGLFAVGEVLHQIRVGAATPIRARFRDLLIRRRDIRDSAGAITRGTAIGFGLGVLPGAGSTLASFMAYGLERRVSANSAQFGRGAIQGVAAPESANNAAANANFIPTLTLGIPGGATTAVLLGALTVYGIQPGPLLFDEQPELVWGLLVSFFIGNVILLVLNLPLAPVFAQLLRIPYGYLYPLILFTSFVGAYAIDNNLFSVWLVLIFGVIGFGMKRFELPMAPLVVGVVIGALFEKALVQSSALLDGNLWLLATEPIAVSILAAALLLITGPALVRRLRNRSTSPEENHV